MSPACGGGEASADGQTASHDPTPDGPPAFDEVAFAALKAEVEAWVAGPGEAWAERIERERSVPPELWSELRERGYLRLAAPQAYGGQGLPFSRYLELMELFAMSHASVRMIVHVVNGIWRAIDLLATDEQRARFVLPQVSGDLRVAFTLTEPTAGTGADLRCAVERHGDTYELSGQKHLITFGLTADRLLLFARLAGTRGAEGTVALMVDRHAPGTEARPMDESLGVRGTDHAHFVFRRTPVPVADRLGAEGDGLRVAFGGFLTPSRISVAMSCVGLARRAQELALAHARQRRTFGKYLAERQAIAWMLAENATDIEAARQLVFHAARTWEGRSPEDPEADGRAAVAASMAKLFGTDMLQRVTDRALQVHGGIGYFAPNPIERVYRDARAQRFEEGTVEIQKQVIARALIGRLDPVEEA
ncbi:MAG TPA: acyl-CoA dehydrogenase family protein [Candidatus Limnocylindrales bacterium]|nr:acyl-CoA dehydrogenase family protein [Candidatus Limnocylindrales bacterium]